LTGPSTTARFSGTADATNTPPLKPSKAVNELRSVVLRPS
jgi:hypothetical protein